MALNDQRTSRFSPEFNVSSGFESAPDVAQTAPRFGGITNQDINSGNIPKDPAPEAQAAQVAGGTAAGAATGGPIGALIGFALGIMKSASDQRQADRARQIRAAEIRNQPRTGVAATTRIPSTSTASNLFGFTAAGGHFGSQFGKPKKES